MVTLSSAGSVQLSPQVSECMSLDFGLLSFIRHSIVRHRHGEFGQVYGPEMESCAAAFVYGGRFYSIFEYELAASSLHGQQLLIISPRLRDTTFVSFVGELL